MYLSGKRYVKECMFDLVISYVIFKLFIEIGRNFVVVLCNSIFLRLFIDLFFEYIYLMGLWFRDL